MFWPLVEKNKTFGRKAASYRKTKNMFPLYRGIGDLNHE